MQEKYLNNVMVDLETLGQEPGSAILSISAIQFDIQTGEIGKQFNEIIDLDSCLKEGLKIDPNTLEFWVTFHNKFISLLTYQGRVSLRTGLGNFGKWLCVLEETAENLCFGNSNDNAVIWARGPRFDFGLLSYAYNLVGYRRMPWNFRNEMCVRTMEMFHPEIKKEQDKLLTDYPSHNGLEDCRHQIAYVSKIYNKIKSK